jgi:hypothetical protein
MLIRWKKDEEIRGESKRGLKWAMHYYLYFRCPGERAFPVHYTGKDLNAEIISKIKSDLIDAEVEYSELLEDEGHICFTNNLARGCSCSVELEIPLEVARQSRQYKEKKGSLSNRLYIDVPGGFLDRYKRIEYTYKFDWGHQVDVFWGIDKQKIVEDWIKAGYPTAWGLKKEGVKQVSFSSTAQAEFLLKDEKVFNAHYDNVPYHLVGNINGEMAFTKGGISYRELLHEGYKKIITIYNPEKTINLVIKSKLPYFKDLNNLQDRVLEF